MTTAPTQEAIWRASGRGRVKRLCSKHPDGWHEHVLIDSVFVDKGLCKHDHRS